jgi:hypothetical protein
MYAAAFLRLFTTHDPWEAARFATLLASILWRSGVDGIPTAAEIQSPRRRSCTGEENAKSTTVFFRVISTDYASFLAAFPIVWGL